MKTTLMTLAIATLLTTGCAGSAQLVRTDSNGGTVALQGPHMPAMAEARMRMVEYCGGRFDAVEHGDHVSFRCREAATEVELSPELATNEIHAGRGL